MANRLRTKIDDLLVKISTSKSSAARIEDYKRVRDHSLQEIRKQLEASTA